MTDRELDAWTFPEPECVRCGSKTQDRAFGLCRPCWEHLVRSVDEQHETLRALEALGK
jgi:hypothetical protein